MDFSTLIFLSITIAMSGMQSTDVSATPVPQVAYYPVNGRPYPPGAYPVNNVGYPVGYNNGFPRQGLQPAYGRPGVILPSTSHSHPVSGYDESYIHPSYVNPSSTPYASRSLHHYGDGQPLAKNTMAEGSDNTPRIARRQALDMPSGVPNHTPAHPMMPHFGFPAANMLGHNTPGHPKPAHPMTSEGIEDPAPIGRRQASPTPPSTMQMVHNPTSGGAMNHTMPASGASASHMMSTTSSGTPPTEASAKQNGRRQISSPPMSNAMASPSSSMTQTPYPNNSGHSMTMGMGTQPMGQTQAGPNSQSQMMMGGMMPPSTSSNGQGQMPGPPYNSANGQSQMSGMMPSSTPPNAQNQMSGMMPPPSSSNGQSSMPGMMPPSQTQMPPMMPSVGKPTVRRQVSLLPAGEARTTVRRELSSMALGGSTNSTLPAYANSGFSNQPSGSITPSYSNAPNSPMMNGQAASNPSPYPPSGSPTAAYQTAPNSGTATNVLALPSSNAYGSMKGSSAPYPMTSAGSSSYSPPMYSGNPSSASMGQTASQNPSGSTPPTSNSGTPVVSIQYLPPSPQSSQPATATLSGQAPSSLTLLVYPAHLVLKLLYMEYCALMQQQQRELIIIHLKHNEILLNFAQSPFWWVSLANKKRTCLTHPSQRV
ncbi:hypothetical protein KEM48_002019 [Puccinia striiformis f. sp. tritici PST-130]|nr:hypothetical protein KEM48_002019 [Puccinia striiformis f. sp. tritici PST-130]